MDSNGVLGAYPIGSIYLSVNNTSPASLFGGVWEQLTADAYFKIVSSNGGNLSGTSSEHKIPISSMPKHTHKQNAHSHLMVSSSDSTGGNTYMSGRYNADQNNTAPTRSYTSSETATNQNEGGGQPYYPYYYGVYAWIRIS